MSEKEKPLSSLIKLSKIIEEDMAEATKPLTISTPKPTPRPIPLREQRRTRT